MAIGVRRSAGLAIVRDRAAPLPARRRVERRPARPDRRRPAPARLRVPAAVGAAHRHRPAVHRPLGRRRRVPAAAGRGGRREHRALLRRRRDRDPAVARAVRLAGRPDPTDLPDHRGPGGNGHRGAPADPAADDALLVVAGALTGPAVGWSSRRSSSSCRVGAATPTGAARSRCSRPPTRAPSRSGASAGRSCSMRSASRARCSRPWPGSWARPSLRCSTRGFGDGRRGSRWPRHADRWIPGRPPRVAADQLARSRRPPAGDYQTGADDPRWPVIAWVPLSMPRRAAHTRRRDADRHSSGLSASVGGTVPGFEMVGRGEPTDLRCDPDLALQRRAVLGAGPAQSMSGLGRSLEFLECGGQARRCHLRHRRIVEGGVSRS